MVRVLLAITLIAIGASGWFAFNNVSTKINYLSDKLTTTEGERDTALNQKRAAEKERDDFCLLYTSPSPRDVEESRMPSSA